MKHKDRDIEEHIDGFCDLYLPIEIWSASLRLLTDLQEVQFSTLFDLRRVNKVWSNMIYGIFKIFGVAPHNRIADVTGITRVLDKMNNITAFYVNEPRILKSMTNRDFISRIDTLTLLTPFDAIGFPFTSYERNTYQPYFEDMTKMYNLEWLQISVPIGRISQEIRKLTKLKSLKISMGVTNDIKEIYLLTTLQSLALFGNNISSMGEGISSLSNITTLNMMCSDLSSVPKEIKFLTLLKYINLRANGIREIPEELFLLTNLVKINFADNEIKTLSTNIESLKLLKVLNLRNNQIDNIQIDNIQRQCLDKLTSLTKLDLLQKVR